jgi:hypothetical protein
MYRAKRIDGGEKAKKEKQRKEQKESFAMYHQYINDKS